MTKTLNKRRRQGFQSVKRKRPLPKRTSIKQTHKVYDKTSVFEAHLREIYPKLKVFRLDPHIGKVLRKRFREQKIPYSRRLVGKPGLDPEEDNWMSYDELFRLFAGHEPRSKTFYSVCIKGGFVRDLANGVPVDTIRDIDMTFDKPLNRIQYSIPYGLIHRNVQFSTTKVKTQDKQNNFFYLRIGDETKKPVPMANGELPTIHQAVEATYSPWPWALDKLDAPANSLLLHVGHNLKELDRIYDITGMGYQHAKQKIWTWPSPTMANSQTWIENKKLWRMLKFIKRGYKVPKPVRLSIYTYWIEHGDSDDFPKINWYNPWLNNIANVPPSELGELCQWLLQFLGNDFKVLRMTATQAVRFIHLMVDHSMLTVSSHYVHLVKFKRFAKQKREISDELHQQVKAINNTDIQQFYAQLDAISHASHGPEIVFTYVREMVEHKLLTTYPVRSDFSDYRDVKMLKPFTWFEFPDIPRSTQCEYRLSEHAKKELFDGFDNYALPTSFKTKKPTLTHVIRVLTKLDNVQSLYVTGPFVQTLWNKHRIEPSASMCLHIRLVSKGTDFDLIRILRKIVGVGSVPSSIHVDAPISLGESISIIVNKEWSETFYLDVTRTMLVHQCTFF